MANTLGYPPLGPIEPDEVREPADNYLYRLLATAFLVGIVVLVTLFLFMLMLLARAA